MGSALIGRRAAVDSRGLMARIGISRGSWRLDAAFNAGPGETIAVIGPNGSGKSTLLESLAGLIAVSDGQLRYDGTLWDDPDSNTFLSADRRSASISFQDGRLFPHLSVLDNVAFAARCAGESRRAARDHGAIWLAEFNLSDLAARRPRDISGGQAARVALARALACDASLLLFDEPMAALDVQTAAEVRSTLARLLKERRGVTVLVSHDPEDALFLADRIVVLEEGRVTNVGTPTELAARPRSTYVAAMAAVNMLPGACDGRNARLAEGIAVPSVTTEVGDVHVAFPMSAVQISSRASAAVGEPAIGQSILTWPARIEAVEQRWSGARVTLSGPLRVQAELSRHEVDALSLSVGLPVVAQVAHAQLSCYSIDHQE